MPRQEVELDDRVIVLAPDDPIPAGGQTRALVPLRLIDELTDEPPRGRVTIKPEVRGVVARMRSDGFGGLVGIPTQVFSMLRTDGYNVGFTVAAEGYLPRAAQGSIPPNPDFPDAFTRAPTVTISLHRKPVAIRGRTVYHHDGALKPLAGATIDIEKTWRKAPKPQDGASPDSAKIVSLDPPLYTDWSKATTQLRPVTLAPIAGDDKTLLEPVRPGATSVVLSNLENLVVNGLLLIDADMADVAEYAIIDGLQGASTANQPGCAVLKHPLWYAHRTDARVEHINPPGASAPLSLEVDAQRGDACVFLSATTGLSSATHARIDDGGTAHEDHRLRLFSTVSDTDGYYRLPPLNRVAQISIGATSGSLAAKDVEFGPDYTVRENRLDIILK